MELLLLVVLLLGAIWLAARTGVHFSDRTVLVIVRGLAAWETDAWPRGVQEEDPDRPWGRPGKSPPVNRGPAPTLVRVKPVVHAR